MYLVVALSGYYKASGFLTQSKTEDEIKKEKNLALVKKVRNLFVIISVCTGLAMLGFLISNSYLYKET